MKKELKSFSKEKIEEEIKKVLSENSSKERLKKLKRLAMSRNIKIGGMRKQFCKKCYSPFDLKSSEIRIKSPFKKIRCKNCGHLTRYKLK